MTFGDLLDRYYARVGDRKVSPRMFPLVRAKELINSGFRRFRIRVQDHWIEMNEALVADQPIYTLPDRTVRVERIAYEDRTVRPATIIELVSEHHRWQTETSDRPRAWTTEDVQYDEYRIYPIPDASTQIAVTMDSDNGILGSVKKTDGTYAIFPTEQGFVGQVISAPLGQDAGIIAQTISTGIDQLTLWLVNGTSDLQEDGDEIQIRQAFALAALYDALAETYSELGDHYNPELAAYYEARFEAEVKLAMKMYNEMMAFLLMGVGADANLSGFGVTTFPSKVLIDGVPQSVTWPKDECDPTDSDEYFI